MKSFHFCIALLFVSHLSFGQIVFDTILNYNNDSCLKEGLDGVSFYDDTCDSTFSQYFDPKYQWKCYKMDNNDSISFLLFGDLYKLEISYQYEKLDVCFAISKGHGKKIDNYFLMTDDDFGFNMKIEFEDDSTIVFLEGFCPLVGRSFSLQGFSARPYNVELLDRRNLSDLIPSTGFLERRKKTDTLCLLDMGIYVTDNVRHVCDLHITSESGFKYYILDILLLEGEIKRYGNYLLLYDDCLMSEFYGFVEDNSLFIRLPLRAKGFNKFRLYDEIPEDSQEFKEWLKRKKVEFEK